MLRFLTTVLCSAALAAQTPPCISLNDATNTSVTTITAAAVSGPTSYAYQITPAQTTVLLALQIFTTNTNFAPGFMSLEVFDHDPVTNLPGSRLAGGTWRLAPNLGAEWQGCNLDQLVVLLQGTSYWIVWTEPGFSRLPYESGGTAVPVTRRVGTGPWSASSAVQPLKYRGFCSLLDSVSVAPVGTGCALANGAWPALFTNQQPLLGNGEFRIEACGMPAGSLAVFVLGWDPTFVSVPAPGLGAGCMQHTDVLTSAIGVTGTGNVRATLAVGASGHAALGFPIPSSPGFLGLFFAAQVAAYDPALASPVPFAVSNGLRFFLM